MAYDITSPASYENLKEWYDRMREQGDPLVFLVANKQDMQEHELVDFKQAASFAKSMKSKLYATSAKEGTGIQ